MNPIVERSLRRMSDAELMESVFRPTNGDFLTVRPEENQLIDGITRYYEMVRRMQLNPTGVFHADLEIPIQVIPRLPLP
jgi:hypothetical protein